jgi:hypothetical protein
MARINHAKDISGMATSHTDHLTFNDEAMAILRDVASTYIGESVTQRTVQVARCDGTHGVWIVAFGDVKLVYKQFITHDAQAFSHASTFQLQRTLYQLGLAAEPLYFDAHKAVWIEAYLPAQALPVVKGEEGANSLSDHSTIQNSSIQNITIDKVQNETIHILTQTLVNLHQVRAVDVQSNGEYGEGDGQHIRWLDPFEQADYLLAQLTPAKAKCFKDALSMLRTDIQSTTNQDEPWVLCHNDLHVAHVRTDKRCIDWEYAGIGPRYFDVAMCITINQIYASVHHAFIEAYAQLTDTDLAYVQQQVASYLRLCTIINQMWEQVLHHSA